jgi:hypothetical protein
MSALNLSKRLRSAIGVVFLGQVLSLASAHAQTCLSITSNGGNGNGTADNVAAFNATLALLPAQGGCISFPAGKYRFASALTVNFPSGIYSLTIVGVGSDNTTLYFPVSDGITVNAQNTGGAGLQSVHVRDVTFTTGQAGSYSALIISKPGDLATYPQSEIIRTTFRGDDGAALTDYWSVSVALLGVSNFNFDGDLFYGNADGSGGTGIFLSGCSAGTSDESYDSTDCTPAGGSMSAKPAKAASSAAMAKYAPMVNTKLATKQLTSTGSRANARKINPAAVACSCEAPPQSPYGVAYNIAKSGFYNLGAGIEAGTLIQGVTVTQSNFANGTTGILLQANAVGLTEITVVGSTFNCTGTQILDQAPVASIIMNGNLLNVRPNAVGLWINHGGGSQNTLINNLFVGSSATGPSGTGVMINFTDVGVNAYSVASGNVFNNLSVGVDLTWGIDWNVQANAYDAAVATQVYNPLGTANSVGVATD